MKQNQNQQWNRNRRPKDKGPQGNEIGQAGSTRGDDMIEKTLNAQQAAAMIPCSRSHVYRLLESGEITGYYTGNRRGLRVIVKSVEEFIERRKYVYAVEIWSWCLRVDIFIFNLCGSPVALHKNSQKNKKKNMEERIHLSLI